MGAAMGFFAAASHFMIIKAFEFASASELSPFNYFEIVVAIILSYLSFWMFLPNVQAILGLIIIILSGLYVSWRAMKNNQDQENKQDALDRAFVKRLVQPIYIWNPILILKCLTYNMQALIFL